MIQGSGDPTGRLLAGVRLARLLVGPAILLGVGCVGGQDAAQLSTVRDSSGVRIVESLQPQFASRVIVDSVPLLTIPNDFGAPEAFLFDVRGIAQFSDGRFVVGNAGSRELYYFAPDGSASRSVGGPGEGPGELESLYALAGCADDQVAVQEQSRFSVFDAGGRLLQTVRVAGHLAERSASLVALSPDCASALVVTRAGGPPPVGVTVFERFFPLYWVGLVDGARDSIGMISALDVEAIEMNGRRVGSRRPFGREAVWGASGQDAVLGLGWDFEVMRIGRGGTPRQIIRWSAEAQSVTEEDWNYFLAKQEEYRKLDPEEASFMRSPDEYSVPAEKPPYSRLVTDDEGRLWLQQYGRFTYFAAEPSTDWWVFAADGGWLGTVTMPVGLEVFSISQGRIMGVRRDALDLEEVLGYRVPTELSGGG